MKKARKSALPGLVLALAFCVPLRAEDGAGGNATVPTASNGQGAGGKSAAERLSASVEYKRRVKELVYGGIATLDEAGFTRMPDPQPGEWLSIHDEPPQTLAKYRRVARLRPTAERRTIVLQPLSRDGQIQPDFKKQLEQFRAYAEAFFQLPVRVAAPLELKLETKPGDKPGEKKELWRIIPAGHRHGTYDRQFDGDLLLNDLLAKHIPPDAMICMGVTLEDIWTRQSDWVLGLGSFEKRVGVFSLARFQPEFWGEERKKSDGIVALRRGCRVLEHEGGHILGLTHCIFYRCEMNGAYSLEEADITPLYACPLCHRKLLWNIGFDAGKRFAALRKFCVANQLAPEAAWFAARLKNWRQLEEEAHGPQDE